ncbi:hypothetical protein BBD42_21350 [Paenibacillus sp. BIHB 4019]|uniref:DUF2920 family protein n=1 Tax=Paenibacillus sp. BIHB 4019 TaxID=1870819 RepID=A0A1B2DLZ7_9BACL|nr:DUF2920 family protein [Paenibacillus sp. BIHB 4019]ANY68726.1 hypothetical protein BBD42_21350 [Paenibacillus sp. BIHB 4019]
MAKHYVVDIAAHRNVYNHSSRNMNLYFSEPENGVNAETGLLLFISGYGGHANSNVYKKMRDKFPDQYNFVCIQCDYFGWEYMQSEQKEETLDYFNDMSIMQALDNITAVLMVIAILKDNDLSFNERKIVAYGHSHGAYLAYLCNRFAPLLFSAIIDNSAYIYPAYLDYGREINGVEFTFLARKVVIFPELYDLRILYSNFENKAKIISYHGEDDALEPIERKEALVGHIDNCIFNRINKKDLNTDGPFGSTGHGLKADFLKMFDYVISNYVLEKEAPYMLQNTLFQIGEVNLDFNYELGLVAFEMSKDYTMQTLMLHSIQNNIQSAIDLAMKYGSVSSFLEEQRSIAEIVIKLEEIKGAFQMG